MASLVCASAVVVHRGAMNGPGLRSYLSACKLARPAGAHAGSLTRDVTRRCVYGLRTVSTASTSNTTVNWAQQAAHSLQNNQSKLVGSLQQQAQFVKQKVSTVAKQLHGPRSKLAACDTPLTPVQLSKAASNQLKKAFAAATLAAGTIIKCNVPTWKQITPDQCSDACSELLSSVVKTPFKTYRSEKLYTIELEPPYKGAPPLVLLHGYGSGSGMWAFNLDQLAEHFHGKCFFSV
jgi:hypothetical protein